MSYPPQGGGAGGISYKKEGEGSLVADGTEQTVFDITKKKPFKGYLWIDVSAMTVLDGIIITEYVQKSAADPLQKFTSTIILGTQVAPMMSTFEKILGYRHKLTLQQTVGTLKTFPWQYLSG